jgi:hypothetical protein
MPTTVIITLSHMSEESFVNGEPKMHRPSDEFLAIRAEWKASGKIAAQEYALNRETRTEVKTTVFPDRATYLEWISIPEVQAYFESRNEFLKANYIYKEVNVEDI